MINLDLMLLRKRFYQSLTFTVFLTLYLMVFFL